MATNKYTKRNIDRDISAAIDDLAALHGYSSSTLYLERVLLAHIEGERKKRKKGASQAP